MKRQRQTAEDNRANSDLETDVLTAKTEERVIKRGWLSFLPKTEINKCEILINGRSGPQRKRAPSTASGIKNSKHRK